jgi:hypothetical protein
MHAGVLSREMRPFVCKRPPELGSPRTSSGLSASAAARTLDLARGATAAAAAAGTAIAGVCYCRRINEPVHMLLVLLLLCKR